MFSLKNEVAMLDMIQVVETLNEVKSYRDCDKLTSICNIVGDDLVVGYEVGGQEESLRCVVRLSVTHLSQLRVPYAAVDIECNNMIDKILSFVGEEG